MKMNVSVFAIVLIFSFSQGVLSIRPKSRVKRCTKFLNPDCDANPDEYLNTVSSVSGSENVDLIPDFSAANY